MGVLAEITAQAGWKHLGWLQPWEVSLCPAQRALSSHLDVEAVGWTAVQRGMHSKGML